MGYILRFFLGENLAAGTDLGSEEADGAAGGGSHAGPGAGDVALNLALVGAGAVVVLQNATLVSGAADPGVAVAADYPVAGLVGGALVIGPFRDQAAAAFGAEGCNVAVALGICVALDQNVGACVPCVHVPTPN